MTTSQGRRTLVQRARALALLLGLAAVMALAGAVYAQEATDGTDGSSDADVPAVEAPAPAEEAPVIVVAPSLFITVSQPADLDVTVSLPTTAITIQGITLPNAVVSVDGDLVDVDSQGLFSTVVALDEGANPIEIVASDQDGHQTGTTLFVVRGDEP
jgi:hypothetical protein